MGRDGNLNWRSSRIKNFELDLEWLRRINVRRSDTQQVDSQSMRVTLVRSAISHAAATVTAAEHTAFTFRCRRVPKLCALTNIRDVNELHFLCS